MFKKIAALALVAATALFGASAPAFAAPKLTGTLPDPTSENETVPLSFGLSGVDWDDALVTIEVAEGGLTVDIAGDAAEATGYDATDATSSTQSFYGTVEAVTAILEDGIDWHTPATVGEYTIDFTLSVQEYVSGLSYNPANGHYYLVPEDEYGDPLELSAEDAFANANDGDYVYAGLTGYVAEINDEQENEFVAEYSGGEDIWIGGTAEHTLLDLYTEVAYDSDSDWVWVHSWTLFAEGLVTPAAVGGAYTSFATGEPNGGDTEEGCLVTNWDGGFGEWNDLACDDTWSNSFIIEFEPDGEIESTVLTLTDEEATALAETGVEADGILLAAGALALAGAGALVYRRRRV